MSAGGSRPAAQREGLPREMPMSEDRINDSIRQFPEYERLKKHEKDVLRVPGLKARLDSYRKALYELYANAEGSDLIAKTAEIREAYADVLSLPEAQAYLRAEAVLLKKVREIVEKTVRAADVRAPE